MKSAAKNQTGATLRMNIKMFNGNNSSHKLLLTTRQKTKLRSAFENNMSTNINRSINESSSTFGKKYFSSITAVSAIDTGIKKKHGSEAATLIISNENCSRSWRF